MPRVESLQDRIAATYPKLSVKLRIAANHVADNPLDIATRSLRSVATNSGVSPSTFSRLARALGYESYENMREEGRRSVERRVSTFSQRAANLRASAVSKGGLDILKHQAAACISNIETLCGEIDGAALEKAIHTLHAAHSVLLVGSMSSSGPIDYFGYMAQWFKPNWRVAGRNETELPALLSRMGSGDAVFAIAKAPHAQRTISALRNAHERKVPTVVVTDSPTSPALQYASHAFIASVESPQFFSSYAATLVLIESIISMLIVRSGPEAEELIRATEDQIARFGLNWATD